MDSPASTNANSGEDTKPQQHGTHTFNFCSECSNMLYPEEDIDTRKLYYKCRTCNYSELASSLRVMKNELNTSAGETAGVTQDVGSDPTVSTASVNQMMKETPFSFVRMSCLDYIHPQPKEHLAREAAAFKSWAEDNLVYELGNTFAAGDDLDLDYARPGDELRCLPEMEIDERPPTPVSASDGELAAARGISVSDDEAIRCVVNAFSGPFKSHIPCPDLDVVMTDADDEDYDGDEDSLGEVTDDEERAMIENPHKMMFGYMTRSGRRIWKCKGRDGLYRQM